MSSLSFSIGYIRKFRTPDASTYHQSPMYLSVPIVLQIDLQHFHVHKVALQSVQWHHHII